MKKLKKKYSWVVDDFKNNRIKISLEHNTYAKKLFNSEVVGEKIANICTDLWWASIVDIEVYTKLLVDYFGKDKAKSYIDELEPIETKIKPRVYKCTNFRKDEYDGYSIISLEPAFSCNLSIF